MPFDEQFLTKLAKEKELTDAETEVFVSLLGTEMSRLEMSLSLNLEVSTISTRLSGIYKKFSILDSGPVKESRLRDKLIELEQNYRDSERFLTHQEDWGIGSSPTTSLSVQESNALKNSRNYLSERQKRLLQDIFIKSLPLKSVAEKLNITDKNESKETLVTEVFESLYKNYFFDKNKVLKSKLIIFLKYFVDDYHSLSDKNKKFIQGIIQQGNKIVKFNNANLDDQRKKKKKFPIVIAAMDKQEAKKFKDNCQDPLKEEEIDFIKKLHKDNSHNWFYHYKGKSKDWQPFLPVIPDNHNQKKNDEEGKKSIEDLVTEVFEQVIDPKLIEFDFISIPELTRENSTRIDYLRENDCLLIIDSISMYNPIFREKLNHTGLEDPKNTFVVVIRPFLEPMQQIIQDIDQNLNSEFHKRFKYQNDYRCETVNDQIELHRWLKIQANHFFPKEVQKKVQEKPWENKF